MNPRRLSLKGAGAVVFLGLLFLGFLAACSVVRYTPGEGDLAAAAGDLASESEDTRESARDILVRGRSHSVPVLVKLLSDPDENVRYRALSVITRIGPDAGGAVPGLVTMLKDPANPFPSSTMAALGRAGKAATAPAATLLGEADEGTRYWAVGALAELAKADGKAFPSLIYALGDDSPAIRARASDALVAAGNGAVPELVAAAGGTSAYIAGEALDALRRMEGRDAVAAVEKLDKAAAAAGPAVAPAGGAADAGAEGETVLEELPGLDAIAAEREAGLSDFAVADLGAEGIPQSDAAVASDWLRNELLAGGKVTVLDRSRMEQLLAERGPRRAGCTREDCAVELGKLLNVRRMVVGSYGKAPDSYTVTIRVVDVETGAVVYGATGRGKSPKEMGAAIRKMAVKIAEKK